MKEEKKMINEIIIRAMEEEDLDQVLVLWKVSINAGFSRSFDKKEGLIKYLKKIQTLVQ